MHDRRKRWFLLLNVAGGAAVLGSYAWGIGTHWGSAEVLWGAIDGWLRTLYTANMLPATAGYLLMFYLAYTHLDRAGHWRSIIMWNAIFLVSAALWMPLTFAAVDGENFALLGWIRTVLAITGIGSAAVWVNVWRLDANKRLKPVALAMGTFLVFQCAVLDALIWPRYFVLP